MDGLRRNRKVLILTLLLAGGVSIARPAQLGAEAGEETESQLMRAITRETDVWKKLRLLDQWKEEYPASSHKEQRIRDYMMAYFGAKQWAKAFGAAQDLIKLRPEDLTAHEFIILLTPYIGANNRQIQDAGEMSAATILNAGVGKPKAVGEAEWEQRKKLLDEEARVVLGWIAMQRGDYKAATSHFVNVLRMDPGNAHASLWLGKNLFSQGNPYGYGIGLFSLARAAVYEGEGALSPIERKDADTLLTNTCRKYFWTTKGLDSVKESAQLQPIPPPRFLPLAMALPKELLLDAAKFSSILFLAWAALFGACFVTYKRNMAERITSSFVSYVRFLFIPIPLLDSFQRRSRNQRRPDPASNGARLLAWVRDLRWRMV